MALPLRPMPSSGSGNTDMTSIHERMGVHDNMAPVRSMTAHVAPANTPRPHMSGTNTSAVTGWDTASLSGHPALSRASFGSMVNFDSSEPIEAPKSDRGAKYLVGE